MTKFTSNDTKLFAYTGSKAKYLSKFNDLHTQVDIKKVGTYIEAFGGSLASLFHNLSNVSADRVIINDINPRLINLYKQIQDNPQDVIEVFTLLEETFQSHIPKRLKGKRLVTAEEGREKYLAHLRNFYSEARAFYNTSDSTSTQNAGTLLFILQHNFNGIYNESKGGNFNTSFNWSTKNVDIEKIIKNILNLHSFFTRSNVIIENLDTDALIEKYSDSYDTLIYLDPPYVDSEIGYSAEQTTDYNTVEAHLKLLESCKVFDYVMYSNNHNETINKKLENTVYFQRTNGITQKQQNKSKDEVLGFINNVSISMPNITDLLNDRELEKLKVIPTVERLLNVRIPHGISSANNITVPIKEAA